MKNIPGSRNHMGKVMPVGQSRAFMSNWGSAEGLGDGGQILEGFCDFLKVGILS